MEEYSNLKKEIQEEVSYDFGDGFFGTHDQEFSKLLSIIKEES